jgi:hypothetical protein
MKNPKDFQVTPWSHNGKVDKSGPSKPLVHNATRPLTPAPTGMDHYKPVPKSGAGHPGLGNGGHENIGNPYAMSSDRSEMPTNMKGMHPPTDKSEPVPPRDVKKWHKSGRYNMGVPATMGEGASIAKKMKAH